VFNEMKAAGIAPSTSTFNFLIEACATAPQPDVRGPPPSLATTLPLHSAFPAWTRHPVSCCAPCDF